MTEEDEVELYLLRRHCGMTYDEWDQSPAWYLDLLSERLAEERQAMAEQLEGS